MNDSRNSTDIEHTGDTVLIECDLPEPPEKVWRALTEPHVLAKWLMPNDMRPEVGTRFSFRREGAAVGEGASIDCKILESAPNRRLRYSWRDRGRGDEAGRERSGSEAEGLSLDSVVTFELSPTPTGGTHLRLIHSDFAITACRVLGLPARAEPSATVVQFERKLERTPPTACVGVCSSFRLAA
jgi:uncharacterized protein YndB with AHSA1/START domain